MRRRHVCTASLTAAAVLATSLHAANAPQAAAAATPPTVSYAYDKAGRLTTVTDPTGASATYSYDPVGNLTGITRAAAPHASLADAAPPKPAITTVDRAAASVTVHGTNFSALDTVRVDGRFARVTAATGTELTVSLPPGAQPGGGVRVSTPGGTAAWGAPPAAAPEPATATAAPSTVDGKAALAGQVLDTGGEPLSGVELSIDSATTTSGTDGRFVLSGLDAGHHELVIDATGIAAGDHGRFEEGVDLTAGRLSTLPWTTYLPAIDTTHAVPIPPTVRKRIVLRTPAIPGLSVVIPAGTRILDEDGKPVRALSITRIPLDRQPFPGAPGMPLAWTIQPGGAVVQGPGLKVTYPNITNQPAGTHIDYVDHDAARPGQGWAVYGGGRVSADGRFIVPDKQTRLHEIYLLGVSYDQPCLNAPDCPAPGEDGDDGDPVNLSTGLFTMTRTDLALPDVNTVALTRAYRQRDSVVRSFGIGQSDGFNLFMAPDPAGNYVLGLPDGEGIRFAPTGDGTYHALPTPTAFTGAVLATDNHTNFQVTLRSGTVYTFGSHSAKLIAITDRYGNTTTLDRDGSGTLQQVTSPNGRWLAFTWGACGGSSCIIRVSDNTGRSVRYNYDVSARMTSSVDPSGGVTSYVWAPCGTPLTCTELTAVTDPLGIQYLRNTYDGAGRIATQTQADGGVYRFAYTVDGTGLVTATSVTDPKGVVRKVTFNTAGYTVSDTAAAGTSLQQTTTLTRDATSNLVTAVLDPAGRTTASTYDPDGNVLSTTRLAGTSGAVTDSFTYEPRYGRLATATNALGKTSSFAYDDGNGTITATDPLGRRTTTTILAGQPVTVTDPLGNTTYVSYLDGLPVAVADPLGRVATVYYDAAGRPVRRTDPLGDTTKLAYDSVNQVTSLVDPLGSTTRAGYDADGNRLTLTDANGNVTTWTYDRMGRALTRTDALSRISRTSYDLLGEAVSTTDQKGTVDTFAYDALGRLTSTGYGTTSTVTTAYDSANRPTSIVDSTGGTLTQTYDGLDRLTKQVSPQGTVSYGYDKGDRRTSMTVAGQPPVSYAYDTADQLTSITQGTSVTRIGYDAGGQRTSLTLPNGLVTSYGYDAAGQLLSLRYAKGTTAAGDLAYGYDAAGRRTSVSGSLARVSLPTAVASATYDAANQLTRLGSATFTYDADGQLTGDGASTYTWNDRNELAGITGAVTASFGYDALGRRTSRTVGTASTGYLYDGPDAVQELNGSTPTANMVTGLGVDETYQRTDASGVHYPIADALGSVVAQTDATGAVQTGYTYEPFGKTTATGTASSNSSQFTGRENDGTGLYYYRARYYSPAAQRFISADPAGEAASGTNLYAYTGDSPTNATDPSGLILPLLAALAGECVLGALEGVAGGLIVSALTGRKYTLREGLTDAATGCAVNLVGLGIEKGLSKLKGLGKAADVCLHSFTGDTPVLMADGSDKPIGSVREGDRVRTTDPATGRPVTGTVSHVYRHEDVDLTDVTVRDRAGHTAVVHTTTHHRFWDDARHEWVEAGSLAAGEHLRAAGAGGSTVVSVRSFTGARVMYDLTVDRVHTFYVAAGDTTVLVHNCDRQLWQLTREGASATKQGGPFNTTFFKSASDGTWWTTDVAGHGESAFKVYQETSKGLEWIANATKYGDYMTNQWKSSVGRFIPWSMLS